MSKLDELKAHIAATDPDLSDRLTGIMPVEALDILNDKTGLAVTMDDDVEESAGWYLDALKSAA